MKKLKKDDNLLDYIPERNPDIIWRTLENKHVQIDVENKGFFFWITQKLLKKPRYSKIELEEIGSFIWQTVDGKKTVLEISKEIKDEFGDKAEPILNRMVAYLKVLYSHSLISYK